MGSAASLPKRPPVPAGKSRICVIGFGVSNNVSAAKTLADAIVKAHPDKYESWYFFSTFGFTKVLPTILAELPDSEKSKESTMDKGTTVGEHHSAPFVWIESGGTAGEGDKVEGKTYDAKGGRDKFCAWAQTEFAGEEAILAVAKTESPPMSTMFFDSKATGTWADSASP